MNTKLHSPIHDAPVSSSLADFFRNARIEAGFDILTLATEATVATEVIVALETKPHKVALQDVYAVANVLNLDPGVVLEFLHSATR